MKTKNWIVVGALVVAVIGLTLTVGAQEGSIGLGAGIDAPAVVEEEQPESTIIEVAPAEPEEEEEPAIDLGAFQPVADDGVDLLTGLLFAVFALVPSVLHLGGFGAIVGVLVDIAKFSGKLKDGESIKLVTALNAAVWVILWFAARYGQTDQVLAASEYVGSVLTGLVTLVGMPYFSKGAHLLLKKLDGVAFSLSAHKPSAPPAQG